MVEVILPSTSVANGQKQDLFDAFTSMVFIEIKKATVVERIVNFFKVLKS
jgi:hypothetical protein